MAYRPVDVTAAFVHGALYYPIDTLIRARSAAGTRRPGPRW
jgi:hypothetical protein